MLTCCLARLVADQQHTSRGSSYSLAGEPASHSLSVPSSFPSALFTPPSFPPSLLAASCRRPARLSLPGPPTSFSTRRPPNVSHCTDSHNRPHTTGAHSIPSHLSLSFSLSLNQSSSSFTRLAHALLLWLLLVCLLGLSTAFLCPLSANVYGIDFLSFEIRDGSPHSSLANPVIFAVSKEASAGHQQPPSAQPAAADSADSADAEAMRHISYRFPIDFLRLPSVRTTLRFAVGGREVRDFRMIERHYTVDGVKHGEPQYSLLKSYDFNFNFCIPNSVNEWESLYDVPKLSERQIAKIAQQGTVSDSFYFVGNELIMHTKASYAYVDAEEKSN